ncbi:MAG: hypothetical protein WC812_03435 [Candidatus Pacearchaeota archaeon]
MKKKWSIIGMIIGLIIGFILGYIIFSNNNKEDLSSSLINSDFTVDEFSLLNSNPDFTYFFNEDDCISAFYNRTEFIGLSKLKSVNCSIKSTSINLLNTNSLNEENINIISRCNCDYLVGLN